MYRHCQVQQTKTLELCTGLTRLKLPPPSPPVPVTCERLTCPRLVSMLAHRAPAVCSQQAASEPAWASSAFKASLAACQDAALAPPEPANKHSRSAHYV